MPEEPSPELVRELWRYMGERYGTRIVPKRSSRLMRAVAWGLDLLGVVPKDAFLEDFATTFGNSVYVPFGVGDRGRWSLWGQLAVCVHEHQHIVQWSAAPLRFCLRYVLSSRQRALIEADAYACNMAMSWWWSRSLPSPEGLAGKLERYACDEDDVRAARDALVVAGQEIQAGRLNEASQVAIDWLRQQVGEPAQQ